MGVRREKWRSGGGFPHPGPSHLVPAGKASRPRGDRVAVGALMGNTGAGVLAVERTTLTHELRYLRAQLRGGSSGPPAAGG